MSSNAETLYCEENAQRAIEFRNIMLEAEQSFRELGNTMSANSSKCDFYIKCEASIKMVQMYCKLLEHNIRVCQEKYGEAI